MRFGNTYMSHIGKKLITLPNGVTATVADRVVTVKGSRGELTFTHHPDIEVKIETQVITCKPARQGKQTAALWGTTRAQIANMVEGVSAGWRRLLELQGVGYRAALKGNDLELSVGFSHSVKITPPEGISFAVAKELITVEGNDKQVVGEMAAQIRGVRPPEPYKGKGIRYQGEHVRRKVGKVVGTTGA